jgi:hypothetical protein
MCTAHTVHVHGLHDEGKYRRLRSGCQEFFEASVGNSGWRDGSEGTDTWFLARERRPAVVEPRPAAVPGLAKPAGGQQTGQDGLKLVPGRGPETGYSFARYRQ